MDTLANGDVNLTLAKIKAFYNAPNVNKNWAPVLHNEDICPGWTLTADQLAVVRCALHFRRLESIHTGLRWHDLKRYGIEITHRQGTDPVRTLVWNDDRRAIQLPKEVISAGMSANPRVILGDNVSGSSFARPITDGKPIMVSFIESKTLAAQLTRESND